MTYSLIELIEIITKLIGDWEMQFILKTAVERLNWRR